MLTFIKVNTFDLNTQQRRRTLDDPSGQIT